MSTLVMPFMFTKHFLIEQRDKSLSGRLVKDRPFGLLILSVMSHPKQTTAAQKVLLQPLLLAAFDYYL